MVEVIYVAFCLKGADHLFFAGQSREILHNGHAGADLGQQGDLLQGGIAAADDGDVLPLIERAVADCTEGNAVADQRFLIRQMQSAVPCTGGDDDASCFIAAGLADDGLDVTAADACDGVHVDVCAQRQRLFQHSLGKLVTADLLKTGIVFELRGESDLTAEGVLFQHEDGFSGAAGINRGGETGRACADDENIVHSDLSG